MLSRTAQHVIRGGRWQWALAYLLLLAGFAAWVVGRQPLRSPLHALSLWTSCYSSLGPLLWLGLLAAVPGEAGRALRPLVLLAALLGVVWLAASTDLWIEQDRPLLWSEIVFRVSDAPSRPLVTEALLSGRMLAFLGAFLAVVFAAHRVTHRLGAPSAALAVLLVLNAALMLGLLYPLLSLSDDFQQRTVCAPWTLGYRYASGGSAAQETVLEENLEGARAVRRTLAEPLWARGPDPVLASLAGRYRHRNVVLVLMESQRLADVSPFGEGSHGYVPLSPFLTDLAHRSLAFTNYVTTGPTTFFAQFSVATGLPAAPALRSGGVRGGGAYGALGRFPDLGADGYRIEWLQPTPITFDRWDDYLLAAGVFGWIDAGETAAFDRTYWTSFGMPDEQLYDLAWQRYERRAQGDAPYFLCVLTVSNHHPFSYPPDPELDGLSGHQAGAKYADLSLRGFVEKLLALPEPERPVIFVTADHGHRAGLADARPLGPYNLESLRLPGFLVTPDGARAGGSCETPFNHEDVLDLIYLLVGPSEEPGQRKFLDLHRVAAVTVTDVATATFTPRAFLLGLTNEAYRIEDRWDLERGVGAEERTRLEEARRVAESQLERVWTRKTPR